LGGVVPPHIVLPELPEVEVVRRGLQQAVAQRSLTRIEVREPRLRWPVPTAIERLGPCIVQQIERRGKVLLLHIQRDGQALGTLMIHLGMSGTLSFHSQAPLLKPHDHVDLVFEHGVLRYNDPRRFGSMLWHDVEDGAIEQQRQIASMGIEPFDERFDGAWLYQGSRGRKVAVKQWLLAGHCVVGVGNIYASEALFRAGIRPTTAAGRIGLARYEGLAQAIRHTLAQAIEAGGSSLRDFRDAQGQSGYYQGQAAVYGRDGQPCVSCGTPIKLLRQGQRSTFFCPKCQR
jgi:formamidopyrimidine-DNA glycosylase